MSLLHSRRVGTLHILLLTLAVGICPSLSTLSIVPVGKNGRITRRERIKYLLKQAVMVREEVVMVREEAVMEMEEVVMEMEDRGSDGDGGGSDGDGE